jgi:hypothetical protein
MPLGFAGGLKQDFAEDPCTAAGEGASGWHTHPVWGSVNNLMCYTYDLWSSARTGQYITDIPTDGWHRYTVRCKVNTPGVSDGFVEYFVDGTYTVGQYNLYMRSIPQYNWDPSYGMIEGLWLSNFFGGSGPNYWSKRNNYMRFTNVVASIPGIDSSRHFDNSTGVGTTIPELRYGDISIQPLLFDESFSASTGIIQSHYKVNTPPNSYDTFVKTITRPDGSIRLNWDYYRYDWDYGTNNSWTKVYTGNSASPTYSYDRTNMPTIGSNYVINSSTCRIEYFMGNNFGPSKGWKLHYSSIP